ncbi:MAG: DUF423 domain-containing protein [Lautropia sp.]
MSMVLTTDPHATDGRALIAAGALLALLAVGAGAFAAHGLRARLAPDALAIFETAARYQMYHALALLGAGTAAPRLRRGALLAAAMLFVIGTVLFSGSLYALALGAPRTLGIVTPFGGSAWLLGWLLLALAALGRRPGSDLRAASAGPNRSNEETR